LELWVQAVIAGLIASGVGLAEITTRYRSDPGRALRTLAAKLYLALNAGAGIGALFLIDTLGWKFGQSHHVTAWRILVAGLGALAFFRSSLFMAKIGGADVPVGPNIVLEGLLNACDRDVDRKCADAIAADLREEDLTGLDPMTTMTNLPVLCLSLMQNFPPSDQALLGAELNKIRTDRVLLPKAQVRAVIVQLAKFLSADLVLGVVRDHKELLSSPYPEAPATTPPDVQAVLTDATQQIVGQIVGGSGSPQALEPPQVAPQSTAGDN
jgi:hypothetical protein